MIKNNCRKNLFLGEFIKFKSDNSPIINIAVKNKIKNKSYEKNIYMAGNMIKIPPVNGTDLLANNWWFDPVSLLKKLFLSTKLFKKYTNNI